MRNPTPKFEVSITYSTTTPESVEVGDFEDTGFEVEPEPATLEDIRNYAEQYGIGPRESPDYTDWWDSGWSVQSYRTGEEIQYALHVTRLGAKRGARLDDRTFDRINKILGGKAYRAKNPQHKKKKSTKRKSPISVRKLVNDALK